MTIDVYSHVIPSLHAEAADLSAALLDDDQDAEEDGPTDDEGEDETP